MTPTVTAHLSSADFDRLFGAEAGWEYWFGEARRKPVPTHLHGLLQILLANLLDLAGYIASIEAELRITEDWHPRPDVYGVLEEIEGKYATKPVDVVFEVLSEGEDILSKCRQYSRIGIPCIYVFSPEQRTIEYWDGRGLIPVESVHLPNGVVLTSQAIFSTLDQRRRSKVRK
jgi:Uma2 family endonuclease